MILKVLFRKSKPIIEKVYSFLMIVDLRGESGAITNKVNKKIPVDSKESTGIVFRIEQDTPDHGWQIGCTPLKPTNYHQEQYLSLYILLVPHQ